MIPPPLFRTRWHLYSGPIDSPSSATNMGVPKFYRWLSERYPKINQIISDLMLIPEFDNLYLDMVRARCHLKHAFIVSSNPFEIGLSSSNFISSWLNCINILNALID